MIKFSFKFRSKDVPIATSEPVRKLGTSSASLLKKQIEVLTNDVIVSFFNYFTKRFKDRVINKFIKYIIEEITSRNQSASGKMISEINRNKDSAFELVFTKDKNLVIFIKKKLVQTLVFYSLEGKKMQHINRGAEWVRRKGFTHRMVNGRYIKSDPKSIAYAMLIGAKETSNKNVFEMTNMGAIRTSVWQEEKEHFVLDESFIKFYPEFSSFIGDELRKYLKERGVQSKPRHVGRHKR